MVTFRIGPTAERMQTVRGPCSQKAIIFAAMSYKTKDIKQINKYTTARIIYNKTKHYDCDE